MRRLILPFLWLLISSPALGFSEMVRKNYPSCTSCHVDPSGGGVLNPYGKMIAGSALSTFKSCDKCQGEPSEWLGFGANFRHLNATVRNPETKEEFHTKFDMQREVELALTPVKGFTVVGSVGTYGPLQVQEYQRAYAMLTLWRDMFRLRVGRYTPNFGIKDPDHTLWTRSKLRLGQGEEELGVETALTTPYGDLTLSHTFGQEANFLQKRDGELEVTDYRTESTYGKVVIYTSQSTQVGASVKLDQKGKVEALGVQSIASWRGFLYWLSETDRLRDGSMLGLMKAGVEPYRGIHLFATYEHEGEKKRPGGGIQWFPMEGLDLLLRGRSEIGAQDSLDAVIHVYL